MKTVPFEPMAKLTTEQMAALARIAQEQATDDSRSSAWQGLWCNVLEALHLEQTERQIAWHRAVTGEPVEPRMPYVTFSTLADLNTDELFILRGVAERQIEASEDPAWAGFWECLLEAVDWERGDRRAAAERVLRQMAGEGL